MSHLQAELDAYHGACDDAMRRVVAQGRERVELAKKALSWLTFATRRLTISELREALAIEAGDSKFDPDNRPKTTDIISACCGLAVLHHASGFVSLVHHTVREYLSGAREPQFSENEIGVACVRYLSMAEFESGACSSDEELEQRLRSRPLYEYAAQNWGRH
ncbi:ankyrin repeat protein, partial [Zopfia rhizophila CBS 207.26]